MRSVDKIKNLILKIFITKEEQICEQLCLNYQKERYLARALLLMKLDRKIFTTSTRKNTSRTATFTCTGAHKLQTILLPLFNKRICQYVCEGVRSIDPG
jgi:hypothetical protein